MLWWLVLKKNTNNRTLPFPRRIDTPDVSTAHFWKILISWGYSAKTLQSISTTSFLMILSGKAIQSHATHQILLYQNSCIRSDMCAEQLKIAQLEVIQCAKIVFMLLQILWVGTQSHAQKLMFAHGLW